MTHALGLLAEAATKFRYYEKQHRAKGTKESTAKAEVNAEIATRIEEFIADGLLGGEAAISVGEHAFRAGHKAGWGDAKAERIALQEEQEQEAWNEYDPPEDIKALS